MKLTAKTDLNTNRSEYTKDGESIIFADWISWKRANDKFHPIGTETYQEVKKSTIETIYIYMD